MQNKAGSTPLHLAMTNLKTALFLSALSLSGAVLAQTKVPEPDYSFAFNAGAVSDYRYRGISQSRFKPALQGGLDFSHKSGFYLGAWGSTIRWLKDVPGGEGPLELDFYGGYKGSITESLGFDVGALRYQYPHENFAVSPNTSEIYAALSYGPATLKYSRSVSNLFGFADSKGSGYLDLAASFDLGSGWSVAPHIGRQSVRGAGNSVFSYTDYSVALNKDLGNGLVLSVTALGANVKDIAPGVPAYVAPNGKNLGKSALVLGLKYNF